jgi:hypothetical protein
MSVCQRFEKGRWAVPMEVDGTDKWGHGIKSSGRGGRWGLK